MKRYLIILLALTALFTSTLLFTACSGGGRNKRAFVDEEKSKFYGYSQNKDKILFEYSFDPNRSNDPATNFFRGSNDYHWVVIPEADPASFKVLDQEFAQDDQHLYFRNKVADFVDYDSFKYMDYSHLCYIDKNHVYQLTTGEFEDYIDENGETINKQFAYLNIVEEADANTYHLLFPLRGKTATDWAKDKDHVFLYNEIIEGVDVPTFRVLTSLITIDKDFIYVQGVSTKIPNKHQSSEDFHIIRKDNADIVYNQEYLYYVLVDDIKEFPIKDLHSISDFDSAWYFTIDNIVYYCGEKIEKAEADSFEVIEKYNHMARDNKHLFYKNELVAEGIDPKQVIFDKESYEFFYQGKKWNEESKQFEEVKK